MSTIAKQYKVPSEKVRQNRRAFYELHRKRDEDIKTWFDRIQSVVNICCKFGRCRQFFIIDKFVSELRTDEIERIEHAITDNWSLQQLSKYFVDEHVSMKITSSNVVAENAYENQEWTVKTIKCEAVSSFFNDVLVTIFMSVFLGIQFFRFRKTSMNIPKENQRMMTVLLLS